MRVRIDYVATERITDICFAFEVQDTQGNVIFGDDTQTMEQPIHAFDGVGAVCFDLPRVPLLDGAFLLSVIATTRNGGEVLRPPRPAGPLRGHAAGPPAGHRRPRAQGRALLPRPGF